MKSKLRMRISSIFIAVIMLINLLPVTAFATGPDWSGYTAISSAADLKNIANDMDGKYYLTQNITLTENWTPLGLGRSGSYDKFDGTPFTGTFDGNGHTISGLDTTTQFETYAGVGLFASVGAGGTIRNLTLSDANVYGRYWVGGFAGLNSGTIENCHLVDSKVGGYEKSNPSQNYNYIGGSQIGGIIGWNLPDGVITDSSVIRSSVLGNLNVGGVTGRNNGTISQSFVRDCSDDHWIGTKYQKSNATYSTALAMVCNSLMMQSQGYYNLTTPYMYVGGLVGSNESSQALEK